MNNVIQEKVFPLIELLFKFLLVVSMVWVLLIPLKIFICLLRYVVREVNK